MSTRPRLLARASGATSRLPAAGASPTRKPARYAWWPWARRILTFAFFALVATLIVVKARQLDWGQVATSLRAFQAPTLLVAAAIAAASHLLFCSFDLMSRAYAGHALPSLRVLAVAAVSYACSLNLGAMIGGVGFRYRLYSRAGLKPAITTRVVLFSIFTNWLGYTALLGVVLAAGLLPLPDAWHLGRGAARAIGGHILLVVAGYVAFCALARKRDWQLLGHKLTLPTARMAVLQLFTAMLNWTLMGALVTVLFNGVLPLQQVLTVLLVAAIAGALAHVPAGLGVLELVFITFFGATVAEGDVVAALLAYRGIYYLIPLVLAVPIYVRLEATPRRHPVAARS